MFLKYSGVSWQWLRMSDTYNRHLALSDVNTLYVFSLVPRDETVVRESVSLGVISFVPEDVPALDATYLCYTCGLLDSTPVSERMAIEVFGVIPEFLVPVEVVSVRFASPFAETRLVSDRIVTKFTLRVRDALSLNEAFFFGGVFNIEVNNVVFVPDKLRASQKTPSADVAAVSEFVRVGLRHMIDFYLGGATLGSVVFGGRLR